MPSPQGDISRSAHAPGVAIQQLEHRARRGRDLHANLPAHCPAACGHSGAAIHRIGLEMRAWPLSDVPQVRVCCQPRAQSGSLSARRVECVPLDCMLCRLRPPPRDSLLLLAQTFLGDLGLIFPLQASILSPCDSMQSAMDPGSLIFSAPHLNPSCQLKPRAL
mmetsp:Transcript_7354/g.22744  ORF Transcript_7354/g.22744 Transcript_7354/m.22744 type:complete len:163 (+) Transcript_7354:840-1328(+)